MRIPGFILILVGSCILLSVVACFTLQYKLIVNQNTIEELESTVTTLNTEIAVADSAIREYEHNAQAVRSAIFAKSSLLFLGEVNQLDDAMMDANIQADSVLIANGITTHLQPCY